MGLNAAHQGYEYQDLLIAYFILEEILHDKISEFHIDAKLYAEDKFDDLTITSAEGIFKKQIKYSNETHDHTLDRQTLSAYTTYDLALEGLYKSWLAFGHRDKTQVRLCLAWNSPTDELKGILTDVLGKSSFNNYSTKVCRIDIDKFWPAGGGAPDNWRKFNSNIATIDRGSFEDFLRIFLIELELPKLSQDIYAPGQLERIVINQADSLGIGCFPNDHYKLEEFILALVALVKKHRSIGTTIYTSDIYNYFNIKTDYGSIQQEFPIVPAQNIETGSFYQLIVDQTKSFPKISLVGAPGSGKSWLVENFKSHIKKTELHLIRHVCYTDLQDAEQKKRIQLNVFYGNIIQDIISQFPALKEKKTKKFASSFIEVNNLLKYIKEDTILVIDGLDHIERILNYKNYDQDIAKKDTDILAAINQLEASEFVKIIVVSQPIQELSLLKGYHTIQIPDWKKPELVNYLAKNNIGDTELANEGLLSDYLVNKSAGNPLYLKYLTDEISSLLISGPISVDALNCIPGYNSTLNDYYQYILSKLNLREQVPRILSGVNFSLTKNELIEITGEGDGVSDSLKIISSVVKLNVSQNGYSIYHESFRRFILDTLIASNVSLEQNIFNPIVNWFEKTGVYENNKSFKFYFEYVYELNENNKLIPHIKADYVSRSIYYGHSWDSIDSNYEYLFKAALKAKSIPMIVLTSELYKTLSSTRDTFESSLTIYLEALGTLRGFKHVADYLTFDGIPTLSGKLGLKVCKLCQSYGIQAPWKLYVDYYKDSGSLDMEDFKLYLNFQILVEQREEITKIAHRIDSRNNAQAADIFHDELYRSGKESFIEELRSGDAIVNKLLEKQTPEQEEPINLDTLADKILQLTNMSGRDADDIIDFISNVSRLPDEQERQRLLRKFNGINWFGNWIRFAIQLYSFKNEGQVVTIAKLNDLFEILKYDTDPFKGKMRTCDLHSIEGDIYTSFEEGLSMIKEGESWDKIIDILLIVSDKTTTSLQRSLGGPLTTEKLFLLLTDFVNDNNRDLIIKTLEDEIAEKETYHLHSYIAEYYFHLSSLYAPVNDMKADELFKKGIEFILGYTFRKDLTIEDLIDVIESIAYLEPKMGNEYIKKIKPLVDAVVDHTDGRSTSHFPIEWFEKYSKINLNDSAVYLLNSLVDVRIDWRLERSLQKLLEETKGTVNPIIELLISRTFPIASSEYYVSNALNTALLAKPIDENLARNFFMLIYDKSKIDREGGLSADLFELVKKNIDEFGIRYPAEPSSVKRRQDYSGRVSAIDQVSNSYVKRKEFSEMSNQELSNYIQENDITEKDLNSLTYIFDGLDPANEEYKEIINAFFSRFHHYKSTAADGNVLFDKPNEITAYYWVNRFLNDVDGWYKSLVNNEALRKAHAINDKKTIEFLFTGIGEQFKGKYPRVFSANLLNALVKIGFDRQNILQSWENLYTAIDFRLPNKDEADWNSLLKNDLGLTLEETLVCILFTRFKSCTSERYHWTISAITYLLHREPQKLIKPFKWFLANKDKFLLSIQLTVVQTIYDYDRTDNQYQYHFTSELEAVYPTNYYSMDVMLMSLLKKSRRLILTPPPSLSYPISDDELEYWISRNDRHKWLESEWIDLHDIFGKFRANFKVKYPFNEFLEAYSNRMYKQITKNLYISDYILELINTDLYYELHHMDQDDENLKELSLNLRMIVAQSQSRSVRPVGLLRPSEESEYYQSLPIAPLAGDWVRIGHYEHELFANESYEFKDLKILAGAQFGTSKAEKFPFSKNILRADMILDNRPYPKSDNSLVHLLTQSDDLENYKILWMNPEMIKKLNLEITPFYHGLAAIDEDGLALRYNCWKSEYLALGHTDRLSDEISKLNGAELLLRKDLFDQICNEYETQPTYNVLKIGVN